MAGTTTTARAMTSLTVDAPQRCAPRTDAPQRADASPRGVRRRRCAKRTERSRKPVVRTCASARDGRRARSDPSWGRARRTPLPRRLATGTAPPPESRPTRGPRSRRRPDAAWTARLGVAWFGERPKRRPRSEPTEAPRHAKAKAPCASNKKPGGTLASTGPLKPDHEKPRGGRGRPGQEFIPAHRRHAHRSGANTGTGLVPVISAPTVSRTGRASSTTA